MPPYSSIFFLFTNLIIYLLHQVPSSPSVSDNAALSITDDTTILNPNRPTVHSLRLGRKSILENIKDSCLSSKSAANEPVGKKDFRKNIGQLRKEYRKTMVVCSTRWKRSNSHELAWVKIVEEENKQKEM